MLIDDKTKEVIHMELYLNDVYPYAQQISNYIEREIFQQKLKAGQKLLSITNLSKELNVSKHTIQLSYKILRKKELIFQMILLTI